MVDRGRVASLFAFVCAAAICPVNAAELGPVSIFADDFESASTCEWGAGSASCPGMHLETPTLTVDPGETGFFCYYFHSSNVTPIAARRIASRFGPGIVDIVWYHTYDSTTGDPADRQPPGTLSTTDCGFLGGGATTARWVYSAHRPIDDVTLPADDGAGTPLGLEIDAGQPGFVQIYVSNGGAVPLSTALQLDAEALPEAAPYVPTAGYFTYNALFSVPPDGSEHAYTKTCAVPPSTRFWWFSTRTHEHGTEAKLESVVSGTPTTLVVSTDWADPAVATYDPPSFFDFGPTGTLRYTCTFVNSSGAPITPGNDPVADENCVGLGYFFPATGPLACVNDIGPI